MNTTVTTAQYCENGDLITLDIREPHSTENFCSICGAKTITCCPHCGKPIVGQVITTVYNDYLGTSYKNASSKPRPSYCSSCGRTFPWVDAAINKVRSAIGNDDNLSDSHKEALSEILPDVISVSAKTPIAAERIKSTLALAGKFAADALRQFVIDFGSELAVKIIMSR